MSDTVRLGGRGCPCGRSFTLIEGIEGRIEDILHLPGTTGTVAVHPIVFHHVLDEAALAGWQVIQKPGRLRVLLAGLTPGHSPDGILTGVHAALSEAGVEQTGVNVQVVDHLERTALGKSPFVRAMKTKP